MLTRKFSLNNIAEFQWQRHRFSLCNLNNSFVFITGGRDKKGNPCADCERLSVTQNTIDNMPDLEVPRMYLSTCAQGTSIFAICGYGMDEKTNKMVSFNTIERLSNAINKADTIEDWEVIQLDF